MLLPPQSTACFFQIQTKNRNGNNYYMLLLYVAIEIYLSRVLYFIQQEVMIFSMILVSI